MHRKPLSLLVALVVVLVPQSPIPATTVLELSADAMVLRSQRIFHGVCQDRVTFRDERNQIMTRYTFWVFETLKGRHDSLAYFVQPGGEHDGIATVIPGLSQHHLGDEVVLFLGATAPGHSLCLPVGLDQGLYRVNLLDGQPWVQRSLGGLHTIRPRNQKNRVLFPHRAPLAEFKRAVKDKLAELGK